MSTFQNLLSATLHTPRPLRKKSEATVHAQAVDAWEKMRRRESSPIDNVYLHCAAMHGLMPESKILLALGSRATESLKDKLAALHYLETLNELDFVLIDHLGTFERMRLKLLAREPGMNLNLRNQTSHTVLAFNAIRKQVKSLDVVAVDLLARHEPTAQVKRAQEIISYFPFSQSSIAQSRANYARAEILRADFDAKFASDTSIVTN